MQRLIAREHNLSSRTGPIQNLIRWSLWVGVLFLAVVAAAGAETDAAPVPCPAGVNLAGDDVVARLMSRNAERARELLGFQATDRKSTRLNSSHLGISYAVFCLK